MCNCTNLDRFSEADNFGSQQCVIVPTLIGLVKHNFGSQQCVIVPTLIGLVKHNFGSQQCVIVPTLIGLVKLIILAVSNV